MIKNLQGLNKIHNNEQGMFSENNELKHILFTETLEDEATGQKLLSRI